MKRQSWSFKSRGVSTLIAAVIMAVLGLKPSNVAAHEGGNNGAGEPIVGLWQVTMHAETTSYAWDSWHGDRTETQNDSGRTLDGNVCQGTWVPLGNRTYGLTHPYFIFKDPSHPELGWTEDNEGEFADASCVELERVAVNESGNKYRGTGRFKCVLGADPFDPTAETVYTEDFTVTAKRVTVDVSQLPSTN